MQENNYALPPQSEPHEGWKRKTAVFLSSQSLSLFGSMLVQYAIIWHITLTTQSGVVLTLSTLAAFLPQILISLFAGVWADRYPRKLLIIGADVLTATSTLVLGVVFLLGYRELWLIFLVSGIRSVGAGIQSPAVNAMLPQLVPADRLIRVNSINGTIQPFIMIAAPVLSGALLASSRLEAIFLVDVVTALLAVGLLLALKVPAHQKAAREQTTGYLDDLKAGLSYIRHNRPIQEADRGHIHHRLMTRGFSQRQTVLIIYLWSIALAVGAYAVRYATGSLRFAALAILLAVSGVMAYWLGLFEAAHKPDGVEGDEPFAE
jgi:MFS family permease